MFCCSTEKPRGMKQRCLHYIVQPGRNLKHVLNKKSVGVVSASAQHQQVTSQSIPQRCQTCHHTLIFTWGATASTNQPRVLFECEYLCTMCFLVSNCNQRVNLTCPTIEYFFWNFASQSSRTFNCLASRPSRFPVHSEALISMSARARAHSLPAKTWYGPPGEVQQPSRLF